MREVPIFQRERVGCRSWRGRTLKRVKGFTAELIAAGEGGSPPQLGSVKDSVQASRSVISTRQLPSIRSAIGRVICERYADRFWMRSNVACLSSGSMIGRAVTGMSDFVPCLTCRTISGCSSMLAYQFRFPGELVINILSSIRCAQISIRLGCLDFRPVVVISTGFACPRASLSA